VSVALLQQGLADALGAAGRRDRTDRDDASIWAPRAVVEGPWQDAEAHFSDRARRAIPPQKHPRFSTRTMSSTAGRLRPARGALAGWYRLTIDGESAAGPATLALTGQTAVEVRVDGLPVLIRHVGDGGPSIEFVPLTLSAGRHAIEIMLMDRGGGLGVALLDDRGRPALTASTARPSGRLAGVAISAARPVPPLEWPAVVDRGDVELMRRALVRHTAARLGLGIDRRELQTLTAALTGEWGWSAPAVTSAALSIESDILPEQVLRTLAAPLWSQVAAIWPDAPLPLLFRARTAKDDAPEKALALYRSLVRLAPAYPIGRRELIEELVRHGLLDEAIDVAEGLLALGRTAENLDAAIVAWRAAGAQTTVAQLTDERIERAGAAARLRRRLQQGDTAGVLAELTTTTREALPNALSADDDEREAVGLDIAEVHRPELAAAFLARRRQRWPDDIDLALREARARDDVEAARQIARRSAHLPAILFAVTRGDRAPWADALERGDALIATRLRDAPPFPSAGSVTLLQSIERHFADDGSSLTMRHFIFEVRNKESIDSVGEVARADDELVVRLRVIKPDGRVLEPEHHDEVRDISLTGLAPGDIVEWLMVAVDDGARDGAFWETSSFASASPKVERRYVASWPVALEASRRFSPISRHGAPIGVRGRVGERIELRFEARDLPALLDEPHAAHRLDDEPQVGIAVDVDDGVVRVLRAGQIQGALVRDRWLEQTAVRLAGDGSPRARLERLFTFIANRVAEAGTAEAPTTLSTGRGQRLVLLVAMARAAGLDAQLLALHSRLEPSLDLPSTRAFPEVVARVGLGLPGAPADDAFVMASERGMLLDALPPSLRGAVVLDLESGERATLPDRVIDARPLELLVDLSATPAVRIERFDGTVVVRLPPSLAEAMRPAVRGAPAEQLARFVERTLSETLPGVQARHVTTEGLADAGTGLAMHAAITIPTPTGGPIRFDHLFAGGAAAALGSSPALGSYARVAERRRTLVVLPHRERVVMTWRIPTGAQVTAAPPSLDVVAGPFELHQRTTVAAGVITWEREISRALSRVSTAEWPAVRSALAPLLTAADTQLVIDVESESDTSR
jgi:hypothetical protein